MNKHIDVFTMPDGYLNSPFDEAVNHPSHYGGQENPYAITVAKTTTS